MPIQKVLIVDDSKTELLFLTEILQKNGFSVRSAENADEAFKRLTEDRPHLILMDVVMPGQNGFQLTRAINRTPEYADIPIIMCTTHTSFDKIQTALTLGASEYIMKPFDATIIGSKLEACGVQ